MEPLVGLWPLACWDCAFVSCQQHVCPSLLNVMCCQVEVSVTGWLLIQRRLYQVWCVCVCVILKPQLWGGLCPS